MKVAILLAVCVAMATAAAVKDTEGVIRYDGNRVYRAFPQTEKAVSALRIIRTLIPNIDMWKEPTHPGRSVDIMVQPAYFNAVESFLGQRQISFHIMVDNVQNLIDQELVQRQPANGDFNFTVYHTYEEVNAWLETLPTAYPNLATLINLGKSFEGRDLLAIKVSGKGQAANKPGFWFDGGIHAREWITTATVVYMLNQLLSLYGTDNKVTTLVDSVDFYVLPIFNPDGYSYTWTKDRMWRKTRSKYQGEICYGVDPNRNWPYKWGGSGSSSNPCDDEFRGPKAFSEVELTNAATFFEKTPNIRGYINFHSYGELFMSPWGYTTALPPDYEIQNALSKDSVAAIATKYGTQYTYGPIATTIYIASGSSVDWTYAVQNVTFSYGVELRDTGAHGFVLPADQIEPSGIETFEAIKVIAQRLLEP